MSDDISDAQSMGMYHFAHDPPVSDELRKLGVAGGSVYINDDVWPLLKHLPVRIDPTMEPGTMRIVPHPQDVRDWQFPDTYDHDFIWHAEYGDSGWVDENDWVGVQERALNELLREAGVQ